MRLSSIVLQANSLSFTSFCRCRHDRSQRDMFSFKFVFASTVAVAVIVSRPFKKHGLIDQSQIRLALNALPHHSNPTKAGTTQQRLSSFLHHFRSFSVLLSFTSCMCLPVSLLPTHPKVLPGIGYRISSDLIHTLHTPKTTKSSNLLGLSRSSSLVRIPIRVLLNHIILPVFVSK